MKSVIQRALITLGGKDDKLIPVQQVTYLSEAADVEIISPYGMHANLPAGDIVLGTLFTVNDDEGNRVFLGYTPTLRPKPLEEGEVVFYHPLTQSLIKFSNDGSINITTLAVDGSGGDLNVSIAGAKNVDVTGDTTINIGGNALINVAGDTTLDCSGDVNISGTNINLN